MSKVKERMLRSILNFRRETIRTWRRQFEQWARAAKYGVLFPNGYAYDGEPLRFVRWSVSSDEAAASWQTDDPSTIDFGDDGIVTYLSEDVPATRSLWRAMNCSLVEEFSAMGHGFPMAYLGDTNTCRYATEAELQEFLSGVSA